MATELTIKQNQLRMVDAQGYDITPEAALLSITPEAFAATYGPWAQQQGKSLYESLSRLYEPKNPEKGRLYVRYSDRVDKDAIKTLSRELLEYNDYGIKRYIFITPRPLLPQADQEFKAISLKQQQHFVHDELAHNPTAHVYVPPQRILSPEEAKTFLTQNKIETGQMPLLPFEDPQNKWRNGQPGQIMLVDRYDMIPDALVKAYPFYRVIGDRE